MTDGYLNSVIGVAIAYLEHGHFPEAGGYFDQPYFLMTHLIPWIDQGLNEKKLALRNQAP